MSDSHTIGAVLAGGSSTRMGQPKTCIELNGRPLISYAVASFAAAGMECVVVAKSSSTLPDEVVRNERLLYEPEQPTHPLLGVLTALEHVGSEAVVVLGCDMPFVSPALLADLPRHDGAVVVPSTGKFLQPLCALYRREATERIREAIDRGRSVTETVRSLTPTVLTEVELARFGDPNVMFFDIDDAEDLSRAGDLSGL